MLFRSANIIPAPQDSPPGCSVCPGTHTHTMQTHGVACTHIHAIQMYTCSHTYIHIYTYIHKFTHPNTHIHICPLTSSYDCSLALEQNITLQKTDSREREQESKYLNTTQPQSILRLDPQLCFGEVMKALREKEG